MDWQNSNYKEVNVSIPHRQCATIKYENAIKKECSHKVSIPHRQCATAKSY